jgi:hypothetical protein
MNRKNSPIFSGIFMHLLFHLTDTLLAPKIEYQKIVLIKYAASLRTLAYSFRKRDSCLTAERRQTR